MTTPPRTVIVGGVAAGMSTAARLRRNDEHRQIIVFERGDHVSFANCGLPYHLGGVIPERDDLLLASPDQLEARFGIDVRVGHEVVSIDRARRVVTVHDLAGNSTFDQPYDMLVLATGAAPIRPPIPGIERALSLRDVADLDTILQAVDELPAGQATAVILGGGFIGLELAENLTCRGVMVTVVELADQVLTPLDPEMAALVAARLAERGVRVVTGACAKRIGPDSVTLDDGSEIAAGIVFAAIGVVPDSRLARAAELELGPKGGIVVDEKQRTSDPHIFAVGDAAVKRDAVDGGDTLVPLAQTANRHGRLVADAICGRTVQALPVLGTAVVEVFGLTAATVGWSEKRLRAAGHPLRAIHTHPSNHAGYYPGAERMALKLLVDPATDAILGAQGVGDTGVDKRIDVIATAMRGGLRASDLADLELAYAPQFGSAKDPVNMLGMVAENLATGALRTIQWHEVGAAIADGATVLDVRNAEELAEGSLPGAVHIPLDELRDRLDEIPAGPLIVTCAAGQRANNAVRFLVQHGRDAVNLDGGYHTWAAAKAAGATAPAQAAAHPDTTGAGTPVTSS